MRDPASPDETTTTPETAAAGATPAVATTTWAAGAIATTEAAEVAPVAAVAEELPRQDAGTTRATLEAVETLLRMVAAEAVGAEEVVAVVEVAVEGEPAVARCAPSAATITTSTRAKAVLEGVERVREMRKEVRFIFCSFACLLVTCTGISRCVLVLVCVVLVSVVLLCKSL